MTFLECKAISTFYKCIVIGWTNGHRPVCPSARLPPAWLPAAGQQQLQKSGSPNLEKRLCFLRSRIVVGVAVVDVNAAAVVAMMLLSQILLRWM